MSVVEYLRAEIQEAKIEAEALERVATASNSTDAEKERAYAAALRLRNEADRIARQLRELQTLVGASDA